MTWVFIAILQGSIVTASFPSEEACLGRKAMMDKVKEVEISKCVDMQSHVIYSNGSLTFGH